MIYIVLGMHKSGTTLVSRMLHASGINMGDEFDTAKDYDHGNLYERSSTVALNHSLLAGCMIPPLLQFIARRSAVNAAGVYHSAAIAWKLPRFATLQQRQQMRQIINDCNRRHVDWGFKDPRTCLTYPLWQQELPSHKLIIIFRSYTEILKRYCASGWRQIHLMRLFRVLHAWIVYNNCILNYIENIKVPKIIINYQHLMNNDAEFKRISDFVGRSLIDVRDPCKYRNRSVSSSHELSLPSHLILPFLPTNPIRIYCQLEQMRLQI